MIQNVFIIGSKVFQVHMADMRRLLIGLRNIISRIKKFNITLRVKEKRQRKKNTITQGVFMLKCQILDQHRQFIMMWRLCMHVFHM